jgi:hypothetical protein
MVALDEIGESDWASVSSIIHTLNQSERGTWVSHYFPPDQLVWLHERAAATPPAVIEQGADAWANLYAAFATVRDLPVEHTAVQALAAQNDHPGRSERRRAAAACCGPTTSAF